MHKMKTFLTKHQWWLLPITLFTASLAILQAAGFWAFPIAILLVFMALNHPKPAPKLHDLPATDAQVLDSDLILQQRLHQLHAKELNS